MKINKKILGWSALLAFLTAYICPSRIISESEFLYGYPIGFFRIYGNSFDQGGSILQSTGLNLAALIINILLVYALIMLIIRLIGKFSNKKNVPVKNLS